MTEAEPVYRLLTTLPDPAQAPAAELAAPYHERREIETALAELKTHLRGAKIVLRSKTPELVRQEFYGLPMAHSAVRGLMHEVALRADADPDQLSFQHAVRVVRRKLGTLRAIAPSGPRSPQSARGQAQEEQLPAATSSRHTPHVHRYRNGDPDDQVKSTWARAAA